MEQAFALARDPDLRLLEEAADEVGRLDATCRLAPAATGAGLGVAAVAALSGLSGLSGISGISGLSITEQWLRALIAATVDAAAMDRAPYGVSEWKRFIDEEQRRVRGGANLTAARLSRAPAREGAAAGVRPDAPWDPAIHQLAPLVRAASVARLPAERALAEAGAALVLCATGRTDRIRLLPFGAAAEQARVAADAAVWLDAALAALAASARARRRDLEQLVAGLPEEDAHVESLGRAALTAARAVALLRAELACTMPSLAESLSLSRPAAADALERLVDVGIVVELTGRRRDRVYASRAMLQLAREACIDGMGSAS